MILAFIHDLRHIVATNAGQAGVSGFIVRDLLRHTNISTTGQYANFNANPVREVAGILGGAYFESRNNVEEFRLAYKIVQGRLMFSTFTPESRDFD